MSLDTARAITLFAMFGTMAIIAAIVYAFVGLEMDHTDPIGWLEVAPLEDSVAAVALAAVVLLSAWLTVTSFAYAAVAVYDLRRARPAVSRLTLPILRRAIDTIAAISIVSATLGPWAAAAAASRVAHSSPEEVLAQSRITRLAPPGVRGVGYTLVPRQDSDTAADDVRDGPAVESAGAAAGPSVTTYVVERGDNLWRISCREMRRAVEEPTLDSVTEYWLRLIAANLPTLRSGDPDLIYPGERITLPPIPGAGDVA